MSRPYNENAALCYDSLERWIAQGRANDWEGLPEGTEDHLLEVMDLCWRWMSDEERAAVNKRHGVAKVSP